LGHLDEVINTLKPNFIVQPGDIVAKVGKTGMAPTPHLHVSYYDYEYDASNLIIAKNRSGEGSIEWSPRMPHLDFLRNPFKHDESKRNNRRKGE
jgi:murein DD-endopeptidase MepM/ murein hydrolase activator NlpD